VAERVGRAQRGEALLDLALVQRLDGRGRDAEGGVGQLSETSTNDRPISSGLSR
jgi:hypothetical protein